MPFFKNIFHQENLEDIAKELYLHGFSYDAANNIRRGMPLLGFQKRGTLSHMSVDHEGKFLVARIPRSIQHNLLERANASGGYEPPSGVWGYALTTPVPREYYGFAKKWAEKNRIRICYQDGVKVDGEIPMEHIRCLLAKYFVAVIKVDKVTVGESFSRMRTVIPEGISITHDLPNRLGINGKNMEKVLQLHPQRYSF